MSSSAASATSSSTRHFVMSGITPSEVKFGESASGLDEVGSPVSQSSGSSVVDGKPPAPMESEAKATQLLTWAQISIAELGDAYMKCQKLRDALVNSGVSARHINELDKILNKMNKSGECLDKAIKLAIAA